jgi:hypothetical protein
MPILTGDVIQYLSAVTGSAGGERSGTAVTSGAMNNVWPDVTDGERVAGGERFRKTFFKNNSATDELLLPVLYAPTLPVNMTLALGLGFDHASDADGYQGNMIALGAAAKVALICDEADTRDVTIYGIENGGGPITEDVTLNGATEVLSIATFSTVWAIRVDATSPTSDITVRQGTGGSTIGNIAATKLCCWLWVIDPDTKAAGIALPDLPAGDAYGVWRRLTWTAGASPVRPNSMTIAIEEA